MGTNGHALGKLLKKGKKRNKEAFYIAYLIQSNSKFYTKGTISILAKLSFIEFVVSLIKWTNASANLMSLLLIYLDEIFNKFLMMDDKIKTLDYFLNTVVITGRIYHK